MFKLVLLVLAVAVATAHHDDSPHTASVVLVGEKVHGVINFLETDDHKVRVQGSISGMAPGEYGFHVHEKGDLSNGCASTGGHYNPEKMDHGHPNDSIRHVGDLGNVIFDQQGISTIDFVDNKLSLRGPWNIIGRAVVLHAGTDDYGKGGHPDSRKTGNAGGRVACGVIGLLAPVYGESLQSAASTSTHSWTFLLTLTPALFYTLKYSLY